MNREQAINYLISSGFTHEQVGEVVRALTYEPTPKNDLGVDCISREQALVAIRNLYPGMPRVDFNGSLRKWVDKYKPYIECDDAIKELRSVTPQLSVPEVTALAEWTEKLTKASEDAYNKGYADGMKAQKPTIKALGEELRKARKGIADEKVLIGYNMAVAICNKHLGESEVDNGNDK